MSESSGLPSLATAASPPGLGSLAQAARMKSLSSARSILILIGMLTAVFNAFLFARSQTEVDEAFAKQLQSEGLSADEIDPAKLQELKDGTLRVVRLIYGGTILLGVVFITLGALVSRRPVAMTVTGLVLYIGSAIVFAVIDPTTLARGIIVKVIITLALGKAVSAAVAYQRGVAVRPSPAA